MSAVAVIPAHHERGFTRGRIDDLKEAGEDFEWYPTTDDMITEIRKGLFYHIGGYDFEEKYEKSPMLSCSMLDIGAGDGRVLMAMTNGQKYAIEKSMVHIQSLPREVFVVGADFQHQTLIDKKVDLIFCNPPYTEYSAWAAKIISEARAGMIAFVLPERWQNDANIAEALKARQIKYVNFIGEYDFREANATGRAARAKVHAFIVDLSAHFYSDFNRRTNVKYTGYAAGGNAPRTDPFTIWFNKNFPMSDEKAENFKTSLDERMAGAFERKQELVKREGSVRVMEVFYNADMNKMMDLFSMISSINPQLLTELGVNQSVVRELLQTKIQGLKTVYWNRLFDSLEAITSRLTKKSREAMFNTLTKHTQIDFNAANAYAVAEWVVKNANQYFDDQVIALVEKMRSESSCILYKSNDRVFRAEDWRYCRAPSGLSHFKLDYRFVITIGGIGDDYRIRNGLKEHANNFLMDIMTVANNLGYDTAQSIMPVDTQFSAGQSREFFYFNHDQGKKVPLFAVRAYMNGNMHLKFNTKFMCRLNVEFGRLKGWLKTAEEASEELEIPIEEVASDFGKNLKLGVGSVPLLLGARGA